MYQRILSPDASISTDSQGWIDRNKNGEKDPYEDPELAVEDRIADLIGQMTIEEKTAQMGTIYGYKRVLKDARPTEKWKKEVWKDGIGNIDEHCNGVKGELEYVGHKEHAELLNLIQRWFIEETRLGIPVDFTNEGIRGVCHSNASNFPTQIGVGATWDKDLVRRIGESTLPSSMSCVTRAGDGRSSATANLPTSWANLANNSASAFSRKAWLLL